MTEEYNKNEELIRQANDLSNELNRFFDDPIFDLCGSFIDQYKNKVEAKHKEMVSAWPLLSGHKTIISTYKNWDILIFQHTGLPMKEFIISNEITSAIAGVEEITNTNKNAVRSKINKHFKLSNLDAVAIIEKKPNGNHDLSEEIDIILRKHEFAIGVVQMKIFLSHKSTDKALVREFMSTLKILGYSPWLDEEAMKAGSRLERSILKGFEDSCAAIFFITPNFKDENYLATEIEYAIQEKRKKEDKFSIITLVFETEGKKGSVPKLLEPYVWKQPDTQLEALQEILKALPIQTGDVIWKSE